MQDIFADSIDAIDYLACDEIAEPLAMKPVAMDGRDMLANDHGYAWRVRNGGWRRAAEGETSRDGLWVVGGGQWRYGC